jgi:alpha-beta hydrolase superfamily lysophospholipase
MTRTLVRIVAASWLAVVSAACAPPAPLDDAGPEPTEDAGAPEDDELWFAVEHAVYPFDMLEVFFGESLDGSPAPETGLQHCRLLEVDPPTRGFADRETEVTCVGVGRPDTFLTPFLFGVPVESVSRVWWVGDAAMEWEYWRRFGFASGDEIETHRITSGDPRLHTRVATGVEVTTEFRTTFVRSQMISPEFFGALARFGQSTGEGDEPVYGAVTGREYVLRFTSVSDDTVQTQSGLTLRIDPEDGEIISAGSRDFSIERLPGPPEGVVLPEETPAPTVVETLGEVSVPGPATREQLTVTSADGLILGCDLYVPDAATFDVVMMVHPSGGYLRSYESLIPFGSTLGELAEELAASGRGFLLCDKRAVSPRGAEPLLSLLVDDYVAEHAAIAADARVQNVYLLGYSLGSILSPQVLGESGAAGAILWSSCRDIFEAGIDMMSHAAEVCGYDDAELTTHVADTRADYELVLAGTFPDDERRFFNGFYALGDVAWWQDAAAIDPVADALLVDAPILAVQGGEDSQCPQASYDAIAAAWADRPDTEMVLLEGLAHDLRPAHTGPMWRPNAFRRKMDATALATITGWLDAR